MIAPTIYTAKNRTSHLDFIIPRKNLLCGAGRVAGTLRCGETSSFVPQNAELHTPISLYRGKTYFFGREFRVAVPKFSRQYHSVCKRDFPMQGDVAPKARIESKNFPCTKQPRAHIVCTPSVGLLSFCFESFWNS